MAVKSSHKMVLLAVICVLLFIAGMVHLLLLRFEAGDVYPPYASLRSDPLGLQVLFESVDRVFEHPAERNYYAVDQIELNPQTTLVVAGLRHHGRYLRHKLWRRLLDRLHDRGGRLVLSFTPDSTIQADRSEGQDSDASGQGEPGDGNQTDPMEASEPEEELLEQPEQERDKWRGLESFGPTLAISKDKPELFTALRTSDGGDRLPREIPWPTPLYFEPPDSEWQIDYRWQDKPVVLRRAWGKGTLLMMADSYLLSNEALSKARETGFLAWVLSPRHRIIFDESHHGLVRRPGIATLARKYRLHGVFGALAVLALLFIWRQATAFVPPPADDREARAAPTSGLNTHEGVVNLMRRHIDSAELLRVCFNVWRRSCAEQVSDSKLLKIEQLIQDVDGRDPAPVYRKICKLLKQGNDS
ncbi:MAG: hypothetical protein PVI89_06380 [Desulfobacteraceae bacterium]